MPELSVRVERVRLLLATMDDPYPRPWGALKTDPGPAASRYAPCETCRTSGWLHRLGRGWHLCLICDGRGWKRRQHGPKWDAYTTLPLDVAVALPRAAPAPPVDPETERDSYAWERVSTAYEKHGSYRELRCQLAWLASASPGRHQLVRSVIVDGNEIELNAAAERELALGVLMIAERMRTVRVPGWLLDRARADERKLTIEELAAAGMTAGAIARKTGIPKRTVRKKLQAIRLHSPGPPLRGRERIGCA